LDIDRSASHDFAVLRRVASLLGQLHPVARLGAGVGASSLALAGIGSTLGAPLLIAPFAATAAIKHAAPDSPLAAPRSVVGGHLLGALVGVAIGALLGEAALTLAFAATAASMLMMALGILHPPAIATTLIALQQHGNHWFPLQVAFTGAATLIFASVLLSPVLHGRPYPVRW
jgi:CBS-domain-containing membrane protein